MMGKAIKKRVGPGGPLSKLPPKYVKPFLAKLSGSDQLSVERHLSKRIGAATTKFLVSRLRWDRAVFEPNQGHSVCGYTSCPT